MRSTVKLDKQLMRGFAIWLEKQGIKCNDEISDWRVFMFKSDKEQQWTQGYDGTTAHLGVPRAEVRFAGPEVHLVNKYIQSLRMMRNPKFGGDGPRGA